MAQDSNDFEALARQYWDMWGDAARAATPGAGGFGSMGSMDGLQGFRDAMDGWTRNVGAGSSGANDALAHFNRQSQHWYGQMQQVAAQFAGQNHSARDVAEAWRKLIGGNGSELFQSLFDGMQGPGMQQLQQWSDAAAPWLQSMHKEAATTLGMPTFGFAREHQERLQGVGRAQLDWQQALGAYHALLGKVSQDAFSRFEAKLIDREEPGRQIGSVRALFDLWVDAAEEAYAETALSVEYRHAYGTLVNAQMRLRNAMQAIMEQAATSAGLPGRAELDSAHRKIAELERLVRRIQRNAEAGEQAASPPPKRRVAPKAAAKKAAAKKAASPPKPSRKAAPANRRKR
ncbi:MAG TPA: class III poly(R)-hydroxyalkanoic acid synthase subunit PhaE [Thermomonas sp.]|nr:class III poly(R)-hydroxyalkanoic acid synthase subunit PhaE [Thermomonas sp.]